MEPGDKIICHWPRNYAFTEGKEYEVIRYEPEGNDGVNTTFTYPAYVQVTDDYGHRVYCHASRFIPAGT